MKEYKNKKKRDLNRNQILGHTRNRGIHFLLKVGYNWGRLFLHRSLDVSHQSYIHNQDIHRLGFRLNRRASYLLHSLGIRIFLLNRQPCPLLSTPSLLKGMFFLFYPVYLKLMGKISKMKKFKQGQYSLNRGL